MAGRDLLVSSYALTLGSGRALRTYMAVRALARLGPLDVAYVPHLVEEPSPEFRAIPGVTFHVIRPSRGVRRAVTFARRRTVGELPEVARAASPELTREATRLALVPGRGRVIAGDLNVMAALAGHARRHPVIYNAHNFESGYVDERARRLRRPRWLPVRVLERRLLRVAAETWMVSRHDIAAAQALVPDARLRYVPNAVDVAAVTPRSPRPLPGRTILLLGDFTYAPNVAAYELLAHDVLPRVWASTPDVRLRVVGRGLDDRVPRDARVEVTGFVDDLAAAYADADVVAVPLTAGAGSPLKFIEALAYGVPVVATPLAARGLDVRAGEHYREAATPRAFAAEVGTLLREGDAAMAARGRALAEREYSLETLARRIAGAAAP